MNEKNFRQEEKSHLTLIIIIVWHDCMNIIFVGRHEKSEDSVYVYIKRRRGDRLKQIDQASKMNTLSRNCLSILDLPDELLRAIFNKLDMVDVLYSMVNVNQWFDRLALDSVYTHHLDFVVKSSLKCYSSSVDHQIVDQICRKILPRIHYQIDKLTVEPFSMGRVLSTADYPELYSLSLLNFPAETLIPYLTGLLFENLNCFGKLLVFFNISGDSILARLLNSQITQLNVDTYVTISEISDENELNIFSMILSVGKHLSDLTFRQRLLKNNTTTSTFHLPTSFISSTLTKLNICVDTFDDCLYLLDGRLECLSTLVIDIRTTIDPPSTRDNTVSINVIIRFEQICLWNLLMILFPLEKNS